MHHAHSRCLIGAVMLAGEAGRGGTPDSRSNPRPGDYGILISPSAQLANIDRTMMNEITIRASV